MTEQEQQRGACRDCGETGGDQTPLRQFAQYAGVKCGAQHRGQRVGAEKGAVHLGADAETPLVHIGMLATEKTASRAEKRPCPSTKAIRPSDLRAGPSVGRSRDSRRGSRPSQATTPQMTKAQKMPRQELRASRKPPRTGAIMGAISIMV